MAHDGHDHDAERCPHAKVLSPEATMNLFSAVIHNFPAKVESALAQRPADVLAARDEDEQSLLHVAIVAGQEDLVESLLRSGADVNASECGSLPLHLAAALGRQAALELLLKGGSWLNTRDGVTRAADTALHKAAKYGHVQCVEALLEAGASVNAVDAHGLTPVQVAGGSDAARIARLLQAAARTPPPASQADEPDQVFCIATSPTKPTQSAEAAAVSQPAPQAAATPAKSQPAPPAPVSVLGVLGAKRRV